MSSTIVKSFGINLDKLIDARWVGYRVAVAMSGGVDSSVTAVLCKMAGCDVVGITMKLWDYDNVGGDTVRDGRCCTIEAFNRCRSVAAQYEFPHYLIDFTSCFEDTVISDFVEEYRRGRTPNPCALCNREIKWGALWRKAQEFGCEAMATGHYVRLTNSGKNNCVHLARGVDLTRDQTYFLWNVPPDRLACTLFPLGSLKKSTVRAVAVELGLPTADTPESRDICFVDDGELGRFLTERGQRDGVSGSSGRILNRAGKVLGRHSGFEQYTIGQRRGLGVAMGRPQYVTAIDPDDATITIGDDEDLHHDVCVANRVNWLMESPAESFTAIVQIRYRHTPAPARIIPLDSSLVRIEFAQAQRAITPGQSAVFYDGDRLLGGGVIDAVVTE